MSGVATDENVKRQQNMKSVQAVSSPVPIYDGVYQNRRVVEYQNTDKFKARQTCRINISSEGEFLDLASTYLRFGVYRTGGSSAVLGSASDAIRTIRLETKNGTVLSNLDKVGMWADMMITHSCDNDFVSTSGSYSG